MDNLNKSISEFIKSGQYYHDARIWYANKYIFPATEKSYILVLICLFLFAGSILGFFYSLIEPSPPEITYISNSYDIAKSYSVIFPAGDIKETPQTNITKYIVSNYVIKRERYFFDKVDDQVNFIRNTTVANDYLNFSNMQSINNPDSPRIVYQDGFTRTIKISDIKLEHDKENIWHAVVYFRSYLKNLISNQVKEEKLLAKLTFQLDDIEMLISQHFKKMNFLVTNYEVQKVN